MRLSIVLLLLGLIVFEAWAQTKKLFVVKTWEVPVEIIPQPDQIRYPEFREGIIYQTNGSVVSSLLNYSILFGEMQFIDSKGDTLSIVNERDIKKITIGEDVFFSLYGQGYFEVIADYSTVKLARKQTMRIILGDRLPKGGYSMDNTYNIEPTFKQIYYQKSEGMVKILKEIEYAFIDRNNRFYPAQKSVLYKLFPRHRRDIDRYSKDNEIDFKQREDLQRMIKFCSQLKKK